MRRGHVPLNERDRFFGPTRQLTSDFEAYYLGQVSGYNERATIDLILSRADWVRARVKGRPGH